MCPQEGSCRRESTMRLAASMKGKPCCCWTCWSSLRAVAFDGVCGGPASIRRKAVAAVVGLSVARPSPSLSTLSNAVLPVCVVVLQAAHKTQTSFRFSSSSRRQLSGRIGCIECSSTFRGLPWADTHPGSLHSAQTWHGRRQSCSKSHNRHSYLLLLHS